MADHNPNEDAIKHHHKKEDPKPVQGPSDEHASDADPETNTEMLTLEEFLQRCRLEGCDDGQNAFQVHFGFDSDREIDLKVKIQGEFNVTVLYVSLSGFLSMVLIFQ